VEGLVASRFPFLPDAVVVRESEIFEPNEVGRWVAVEPWNRQVEKRQARFFRKAKRDLSEFRALVERETGAEWIRHDGEPAGIIARSDEEMDWICEQLEPVAERLPDLGWQRNTIYLRFGHRQFHKGSALAEVARREEIPVERRLAVGDGHNDLQMLDPSVAGEFACPANAVREVKEAVSERGGRVATREHSAGVVEVLGMIFG
jgi:hydroxymethylpyrimidine pyrophosphatase-like HAD family hydrolase